MQPKNMKYAKKKCVGKHERKQRGNVFKRWRKDVQRKRRGKQKSVQTKGIKREKLCRQKDNARQQEEDANEIEPMGQ